MKLGSAEHMALLRVSLRRCGGLRPPALGRVRGTVALSSVRLSTHNTTSITQSSEAIGKKLREEWSKYSMGPFISAVLHHVI